MSQYAEIYLNTNEYIKLGKFSRSTMMYDALKNVVPYGTLKEFTINDIREARSEIKTRKEEIEARLTEIDKELSMIPTFNNSVESKMEMIESLFGVKAEYIEELEEAYHASETLSVYEDILENSGKKLYAGIEPEF